MINLYPHNNTAYKKMLEQFKTVNKTTIIRPTGTGKMYIALKWLYDNRDKKCIYICPTKAIMYQLKETIEANGLSLSDFPNLKLALYSDLLNWNDEDYSRQYDCIVLDEFHRTGAPKWRKCIDKLLENNKNSKVLGLSATPVRYSDKKNMVDEIFEGNMASEMTLAEAIAEDILPFPNYVGCIYGFTEEINKRYELIKNCSDKKKRVYLENLLEQTKKHLENSKGMEEVVKTHCKPGKYIVFCRDINHIYEMKEKVSSWYSTVGKVSTYIVHSEIDSEENEEILNKFQIDLGDVQLLFAVDMLNEGYHPENIDGIVMLRKTNSHRIFLQQLGRAFSIKGKIPIVIDVVNNVEAYKNIYDVRDEILEHLGYSEFNFKDSKELKERFKIYGYYKDIVSILKQIDFMCKPILNFEEKIQIIQDYLEVSNKKYSDIYKRQIYKGYNIGVWKNEWRIKYNKGILDKKIEEVLINLGEDFELKRSLCLTDLDKIKLIKEYLEETGKTYNEISIRTKYNEYLIGRWINHWRTKYNKGKLTDEEIEMIKQLGETFVKEENLSFEEKISIIKEYLEETGKIYTEITTRERYKEYGIGYWISEFRERYSKKKLTNEEIKILTNLGEGLNSKRTMIKFKEKVKIITLYLKENNKSYLDITSNDKYQNYPIGYWKNEFRIKYNKGGLSTLEEQVLRSIGETFELSRNKRMKFEEKIEIIAMYLKQTKKAYSDIKYYEKCGSYSIGYWKSDFRKKYKKGELSSFEEQSLRNLGENFVLKKKTKIHKVPTENIKLDKENIVGEATYVVEKKAKQR